MHTREPLDDASILEWAFSEVIHHNAPFRSFMALSTPTLPNPADYFCLPGGLGLLASLGMRTDLESFACNLSAGKRSSPHSLYASM